MLLLAMSERRKTTDKYNGIYKAKKLAQNIGSSCSWNVIALVKLEEYVSNNILDDHWQ